MKTTPLRLGASLTALLFAPGVLAETTTTATETSTATTTTDEEPSCTASLITTLCEYPDPFRAVASGGKADCWDYCNENQPCDFVIFVAGNPYTGTGTCWLYPGETFDESKGSTEGCRNKAYSVYDKPVCDDPSTTSPGACAATASPSAIASICDYPAPPGDCWTGCAASSGASNCLSLCAKADACAYAVFNPRGETNSPYESGTCWMYPEGEYDPESAGTCGSDGPQQYVYTNGCPKPTTASSSTPSSTPTAGSESDDNDDDDDDTITGQADGVEAGEDEDSAASAPVVFTLTSLMAAGLAMFL